MIIRTIRRWEKDSGWLVTSAVKQVARLTDCFERFSERSRHPREAAAGGGCVWKKIV